MSNTVAAVGVNVAVLIALLWLRTTAASVGATQTQTIHVIYLVWDDPLFKATT